MPRIPSVHALARRAAGAGLAAPARGGRLRRAGCVVALVGAAAGAAAADGDAAAGKKVFALCSSCHEVGPSARAGFGPQLDRVIGRRAGATAGFKYSEAMQKSGIVWSDATLAAFLKDPERVVPGTRMRFYGLSDARKVADLLAYLRTAGSP